MIELRHLSKSFRGARPPHHRWWQWQSPPVVRAVTDVNLTAADGEITGLLGPNGAGKTTSLRMLAALVKPDSGSLSVGGVDVLRQPREALSQMGWLSDASGLYTRLSARENIVYYGLLQGMSHAAAHARAQSLAEILELQPLLDRRVEGFSQGERMKTALARALVHDPAHIVLDEPTNGLDVLATRSLRQALRYFASPAGGSKCVVFSTHIMQEVQRLCDRVVVISGGRTVASGTVAELCERTGEPDFENAFVALAFGDHKVLQAQNSTQFALPTGERPQANASMTAQSSQDLA